MKRILVTLAVAVGLLAPALALSSSPAPAYASAFNSTNASKQACSGINGNETAGNCAAPGRTLSSVIKDILYLISAIAGIVAVVMVLISGYKFMTAAGDAGKVASARGTLTYAIIGLIVVAFAQFIVQFVMSEVT